MKTLADLKKMSKEQLLVYIYDYQKNVLKQLKAQFSDKNALIYIEGQEDDSFFSGPNPGVLVNTLVQLLDLICTQNSIKLETVLRLIIDKIPKDEPNDKETIRKDSSAVSSES